MPYPIRKMKIISVKKKSLFGDIVYKLYDGKVSYFRCVGKFVKLKGDIEFVFFPKVECYNLEYMDAILMRCKNIESGHDEV